MAWNNWTDPKWTVRSVDEYEFTQMAVGDKLTIAGPEDNGTVTRKHIGTSFVWANQCKRFDAGATWLEYVTLTVTLPGAPAYHITYEDLGSKKVLMGKKNVDPNSGPTGAVWTADDQ